ncbi:uncharacterized protein LOC132950694 [Metopolophium dirhodum]|uniref:uncharacterized protein LOC132950694 n=1 Tax=Metopolophium dirhodum TaxID=44670 RepID=UPI00299039F1|nr:uncharacterized protein LOC132950694 [Metopolophium dirhodum]
MTTYKIASGQLSFSQRLALSHNYPRSMLNYGVMRRPPNGYHYETRRHISNTYPRNSYTIRYGLSNVVRNNNRGSSSPSKGGKKKPKRRNPAMRTKVRRQMTPVRRPRVHHTRVHQPRVHQPGVHQSSSQRRLEDRVHRRAKEENGQTASCHQLFEN